jgi:hypothetical protein
VGIYANSKKPTFPVKVEMVWVVDKLKNQKNERFLTSLFFSRRPRFCRDRLKSPELSKLFKPLNSCVLAGALRGLERGKATTEGRLVDGDCSGKHSSGFVRLGME